ncbi:MAG TPA: L-aspartate oxidase [Acidobacteriaceae bacterium]|nr:L-aspartate oxidase [Acidobacteriaceae bacterium]
MPPAAPHVNAQTTDYLVIGAGIAGLRAAIALARKGRVLVITKEQLAESNTAYAQGGIAVAMGGDADVALHLEDTQNAGDGLVNTAAAAVLVEQGPRRVQELLEWGTAFDRGDNGHGELMRTREGAHSLPRILHANGDATGREIAQSLLRHAKLEKNITLAEWTTCIDLIVQKQKAVGVTLLDRDGRIFNVYAHATLLASGGAGQVFSDTTNPAVATGDGIAMAYRAGAAVADMEFFQFHPTALALPGAPRFLISESLRGEGAYLVNARHERFMQKYHPQLELAPRDVVARAIVREGTPVSGKEPLPVYLDMRHVTGIDPAKRFPGISAFLAKYGLSLQKDLIPIRPAAHYMMGGVKTDIQGRTTLAGLYAAGEAACTGVHGANRLASNSLLEGLVFGAAAAEAMLADDAKPSAEPEMPAPLSSPATTHTEEQTEKWIGNLRALMWKHAGLLRGAEGLNRAKLALEEMAFDIPRGYTRRAIEARNLHQAAMLMVESALARKESRGAHYRNDFPQRDDAHFRKHSVLERGRLRFEQL